MKTTPTVLPPPKKIRPGIAGRLAFDPLAPLVAILPFIGIIGTSLSWHPAIPIFALSVCLTVLTQPRRGSAAAIAMIAFSALLTFGFATSPTPTAVIDTPDAVSFLPWFPPTHWNYALNISSRIGSIISLVILTGMLSDPQETVRAFVVHLKMPERIGQAGIVALNFGHVLRREHASILEAHLLRGSRFDLPIVEVPVRWLRSTPALVAAAIRHAERVAISMDSRAFGALERRTHRTPFAWRHRDTVLIVIAWTSSIFLIHSLWDTGFALMPNRA
ncbi:energy-coupling factor transporter transmembrane component T [Schaalia vaccimaxillae]|uniref:energy-coupling factor transporter transmembrane component T n=1 Tax=Schaalia vaccimaxillae TaxID=183916 RepID=UPI0003B5C903|nr:energy-coupling factor transporter transmembrane component T [Schaalia vaccimaxillae]